MALPHHSQRSTSASSFSIPSWCGTYWHYWHIVQKTVHLPAKAALQPPVFSSRLPRRPQSASFCTLSLYDLNLNDCRILERRSVSAGAALTLISKKIKIFSIVQEVLTLFYKRVTLCVFLFPRRSCADTKTNRIWKMIFQLNISL